MVSPTYSCAQCAACQPSCCTAEDFLDCHAAPCAAAEMAPDDLLAPLGRQDRPQQAGFLKQIIDLLSRSDRFRIEVMDGQDRARVKGAEVYSNALDQVVLLIRCQGYHPQAADMVSVHRPEEQQLRSYRRDIVKLIRRRYVTRP
jgi:hypothetical protein